MREISYHPQAADEMIAAAAWYRERQKLLADEFVDEFTKVINFMQYFPESGLIVQGEARRILMNRFPYAVVYLHNSEELKIVALSHLSRRPGYWAKRKF